MRVLLIDDDALVRLTLLDTLAEEGIEVDGLASDRAAEAEGRAKARAEAPKAVPNKPTRGGPGTSSLPNVRNAGQHIRPEMP